MTIVFPNPSIQIGQSVVKQEYGAKLLGMQFTDDLQWKTHINKTITSLNSRLFLIMRLKNKIGLTSLKRIAGSLMPPKIGIMHLTQSKTVIQFTKQRLKSKNMCVHSLYKINFAKQLTSQFSL